MFSTKNHDLGWYFPVKLEFSWETQDLRFSVELIHYIMFACPTAISTPTRQPTQQGPHYCLINSLNSMASQTLSAQWGPRLRELIKQHQAPYMETEKTGLQIGFNWIWVGNGVWDGNPD